MNYINEILKGIFLVILAISGNFIAELFSCKTRKLLSENMFAKHFVILFIIYFAIDFSNKEQKSPIETLKYSFLIYLFFLIFTKMNLEFTIVTFVFIAITYFISNYINYYEKNEPNNPNIYKLKEITKFLYITIIILIIFGSISYFIKQKKEYKNNWSFIKFVFGNIKCKSIS